MTIDPRVVPGLVLLALELLALAAVGYIVARVALRQTDHRLALAQGLVIGPALWGLIVNFILHLLPGLSGALVGWMIVLGLGMGLAWRACKTLPIPPPRTLAGFALAGAAVSWIALASRQLLTMPDELLHTTLPATIRAGAWPPSLSWNPDLNLAYHHGVDLLVALLTPPDRAGPCIYHRTARRLCLDQLRSAGNCARPTTRLARCHAGTRAPAALRRCLDTGVWAAANAVANPGPDRTTCRRTACSFDRCVLAIRGTPVAD